MKQKIKTIWKCHNIKKIDQIMVEKGIFVNNNIFEIL
jgi:hypothetical protein